MALVGGNVRDILFGGKWGKDFDFEVRSEVEIEIQTYFDFVFAVSTLLGIDAEEMPYHVFKMQYESFDLSFAPPRSEIFQNTLGHKNFKAQYQLNMNVKDALVRRDITINAMMLYFNSKGDCSLIDPFFGQKDLKRGIIQYVSAENFAKDPVRALRAMRFQVNFDFVYSSQLQTILESMTLEGVSSHYFRSELKKCYHPMIMLNQVAKFYAPLPFNLKMDKNFFARPYDIETVLCFYALYFGKTKANSDWFKLMSGAHAPLIEIQDDFCHYWHKVLKVNLPVELLVYYFVHDGHTWVTTKVIEMYRRAYKEVKVDHLPERERALYKISTALSLVKSKLKIK